MVGSRQTGRTADDATPSVGYKTFWHELYAMSTGVSQFWPPQLTPGAVCLRMTLTELDLSRQTEGLAQGSGTWPDYERSRGGLVMRGQVTIPNDSTLCATSVEVHTSDDIREDWSPPIDARGFYFIGGDAKCDICAVLSSSKRAVLDDRVIQLFALAKLFGLSGVDLVLHLDLSGVFQGKSPEEWEADRPPGCADKDRHLWILLYRFQGENLRLSPPR